MNHAARVLQSGWFIPLEMRVISRKKEAFQRFSISENVAWKALAFPFEEIEKSINSTRDTPMNQRIRRCRLGGAFCDRPKSSKLVHGIFPLSGGKAFLEIGTASPQPLTDPSLKTTCSLFFSDQEPRTPTSAIICPGTTKSLADTPRKFFY
jgi:hypothetical protein